MASLGEEMKPFLQPSCSPGVGGSGLGRCLGVVLLFDGRWWKWLFFFSDGPKGLEHCDRLLVEAKAGGGMGYGQTALLAWMDLEEVSMELLWFWGCSAGLLGVQPPPCLSAWPWCLASP